MFDDTRTRAFFAPDGLRAPPVREYLPRLIDYYWSRKYATPAAQPGR